MAFYAYRQNNSGGSFHIDESAGISRCVVVEANSSDEADRKAIEIGLYFNGCEIGRDCSCCGDRWYPTYGEAEAWEIEEGSFIHLLNGNTLTVNTTPTDEEWQEFQNSKTLPAPKQPPAD
jgi:hypothetical protein